MTDIPTQPLSLPARLGVVVEPREKPGFGYVESTPEICHCGHIRPSVIMLLVDMVAGLLDELSDPDAWHFTTDFNLRLFDGPPADRITARARRLRKGNSISVTEVDLEDQAGKLVGYSQIGFANKPRRPSDPEKPKLTIGPSSFRGPNIDQPLLEAAGIEVVDPAKGMVQVELVDSLRQPAGMMQGGMVALTLEAGALALAGHEAVEDVVIADMDLRYLLGGRHGPMWTRSRWLGPAGSSWILVELRDRGMDDRLTTTAMVRTRS
jgi:acyl-coenzyme A thioesterase PaaI-like protein